MVLRIDNIDITPYIAFGGVKWQRADIDASDSGRVLDGKMYRTRVALKRRLDITCRPLKLHEASIILKAIYPVFVTVTFTDPMEGEVVTKTMYSNNIPASFMMRRKNGDEYWGGITFPLVEQ